MTGSGGVAVGPGRFEGTRSSPAHGSFEGGRSRKTSMIFPLFVSMLVGDYFLFNDYNYTLSILYVLYIYRSFPI